MSSLKTKKAMLPARSIAHIDSNLTKTKQLENYHKKLIISIWKVEINVRYAMLALKTYEQKSGFSVLSIDELFFINGGSTESKEGEGNGSKNEVEYKVETKMDGKIEFDENGKPKGSITGTLGASVSGKKSS